MKGFIISQLWSSNWKKTIIIKVLEEALIYDFLKGNLVKFIIVGARAMPVIPSSKSAWTSSNFGCVGWGLTSIIVSFPTKFLKKCKEWFKACIPWLYPPFSTEPSMKA